MNLAIFGIWFLTFITFCKAAPVFSHSISTEDQNLAKDYLSKYYSDGQTKGLSETDFEENTISETIRTMQDYFGLEVTGVLNEETLKVMNAPRCGVKDVRKYEQLPGKPKWDKSLITYRITQYTPDLTQSQVDATIAQAFKLYSDLIPLDFEQIRWGTADIMILFQSSYHGDFSPFDGPGKELAHAFPPGENHGGDIHFDEDETWTLTRANFNLLLVAAHEIGHSLGLDHSKDTSALMFANYQYINTNGYKLPDDDRRGVQAIYGSRTQDSTKIPGFGPGTGPLPGPAPAPLPNPQDQQCSQDLALDAATSISADLFLFKNGYYWRKSSAFPEIRFSKVSSTWPQINNVDAAFENPSKQETYIFEGNQYWAISFYDMTIKPGYPQPITNFGLPWYVTKVDATLYEPTTGRAIIFVNDQYWSYNVILNQMDYGFPAYIAQGIPGIGSKVDAAFENHGYLYFIAGSKQHQYYLPYRAVTRVLFNYEWLDCFSPVLPWDSDVVIDLLMH